MKQSTKIELENAYYAWVKADAFWMETLRAAFGRNAQTARYVYDNENHPAACRAAKNEFLSAGDKYRQLLADAKASVTDWQIFDRKFGDAS